MVNAPSSFAFTSLHGQVSAAGEASATVAAVAGVARFPVSLGFVNENVPFPLVASLVGIVKDIVAYHLKTLSAFVRPARRLPSPMQLLALSPLRSFLIPPRDSWSTASR